MSLSARLSRDRPPFGPQDVFAGKYVIRRVLGEGGMAVVYAAVDTSCNRQVAIKVLRPSVARGRVVSSARMQQEASTAVQLHERTQYVVDVLTAGVERGLPYYVMERLRGTTLRQSLDSKRARNQRLEIIEVTGTLIHIATALAFAHQMGIVHRDVKPENVYLADHRDTSVTKLLDFGISKLLADERSSARRREFSGSRPYASPEQLDGQAPTPADDVFALGLIMFEMLTFALPHDRQNPRLSVAETALNSLAAIPPIRSLRQDVPPRLDILMRSCLAYEGRQRPTALDVAHVLRSIELEFEQNLLGVKDAVNVITDVSGPPIEVLAQRLLSARDDLGLPARVEGSQPVDLLASTDPPQEESNPRHPSVRSEVFFWDHVRPVSPVPAAPPGPPPGEHDVSIESPPVAPQPVLVLGASPDAQTANPGGSRKITLRMSAPPQEQNAALAPMETPARPVGDATPKRPDIHSSKRIETAKVYADPEGVDALLLPLALPSNPRNLEGLSQPNHPSSNAITGGSESEPHGATPGVSPAVAEGTAGAFGSETRPETAPSSSRRRSAMVALGACAVIGLVGAGVVARAYIPSTSAVPPRTSTFQITSAPPPPLSETILQPAVPTVSTVEAPQSSAPSVPARGSPPAHRTPPHRPASPINTDVLLPDGPGEPQPSASASATPPKGIVAPSTSLDPEFKTSF